MAYHSVAHHFLLRTAQLLGIEKLGNDVEKKLLVGYKALGQAKILSNLTERALSTLATIRPLHETEVLLRTFKILRE